MRYFLVDFENVQSSGLYGVQNLDKKDNLVIFYSKNASRIDFTAMQWLMKTNATIEFMEITKLGNNALDFNLVYYMGAISGHFRGSNLKFFIVSQDSGFDTLRNNPLIRNSAIISLARISKIQDSFNESLSNMSLSANTECHKDEKSDLDIALHDILSEHSLEEKFEDVKKIIRSTSDKSKIFSKLTTLLGMQVGHSIYVEIRNRILKKSQKKLKK